MIEIANEGEYTPEAMASEIGNLNEIDEIIQNEIRNIGPMDAEELNEDELVKDIENDLKKLF